MFSESETFDDRIALKSPDYQRQNPTGSADEVSDEFSEASGCN